MTRGPAPYVSIAHAARLCDVTARTIYLWMQLGKVEWTRIDWPKDGRPFRARRECVRIVRASLFRHGPAPTGAPDAGAAPDE